MGVSIMWKPVKNDGNHVSFGHRSTAYDAIQKTVGERITEDDVDTLRGMAAATGEEGYNELADAVSKHGEIEVWGEY